VGFLVLVVCTGNICRSPVAQRLLLARAGDNAGFTVTSAGISAVVGRPIDGPCARALQELGVSAEGHVAQQVSLDLLTRADLVLTADSAQRSQLIQTEPASFRRVFTLREFVRLGRGLGAPIANDITALPARVAEVAARRGLVEVGEPGSDDIGDPFGASRDYARSTVARIAEAVDGILDVLGRNRASAR
jgi:protein-tyrosine phosphatase